jgi:penicillin-binding protein 2
LNYDRDPLLEGLDTHRNPLQFRILLLVFVAAFILFALLSRLFFLQVVEGAVYREKARNNRVHSQPVLAPRGTMYDRHSKILASNAEAHSIFFDPRRLSNTQIYKALQALSVYLNTPYKELRERLDFEHLQPVYLHHELSPAELARVLEHRDQLPGIEIVSTLERQYPEGQYLGHFMGHMGQVSREELNSEAYTGYYPGSLVGKSGLERKYEMFLKGNDGKQEQEIVLDKKADPRTLQIPPVPGHRLQLTLDKDLQKYAYDALKASGVAGSIVVMDPHNGEVMALVSYPTVDPNLFNRGLTQAQWQALQKNPLHPFLDRSINAYAPGSIFKIVTTLAALGTGHLTANRTFISNGFLKVSGHTFFDWNRAGFGAVNIDNALAYSIDTVFYELSLEMGIEPIRDYSRLLGLGEKTGIDLPQEGVGIVPDKAWKDKYIGRTWMPGDSVNASIGQGYVQMTPLQATRMIAAVANGGKLVQPHLIKGIYGPNQQTKTYTYAPPKPIPGIPEEHWAIVRKGLEGAVRYGTVKKLGVPGVTVAGKTGTAETIPGQPNHAWIVGYAPAESPRYAITVFLEHGKSGGGKAAPLGGKILRYIFDHEKTP